MSTKNTPKFKAGTKFKPICRKHAQVCTVTDILKTYNLANELVKVRYVASHEFLGQTVIDNDVVETTISRGLIK